MRTMVKFTIPTQETNPLVEDGSIGQKMETMLGKLQPEAAYFGPIDGKRGGFIVINMEEESEVVIGSLLSMVESSVLMVAEVLRHDQTLPRKPGPRATPTI